MDVRKQWSNCGKDNKIMNEIDSRKIIKIALIMITIATISWAIYLLIPKSFVNFSTAPERLVVLIDNDRHVIKNGDTLIIAPGKHDIIAFEDEFNPYEEQIDVKNGETYNYVAALIPLTEKAKNML
jgi:hypothetical protein